MVKELCFRCRRPVYPTDKVGPLKDGTFFHHGCFKCYICGTRLTLRTYFHNRNRIEDQEVYCNNHVPQAGPHDPIPHRSNLLCAGNGSQGSPTPNGSGSDSLVGDMKIKHLLKATEIQKPYPKIVHPGARYLIDYDDQTRLELIHREQEDNMYRRFSQQRFEEEQRFSEETKEEWEKALMDLARRYDQNSQKSSKARDDLLRQLTLKRENQRETMRQRWRERERSLTADLVEKQSQEMMGLYKKARQQTNGTVNDQNDASNYPSTPPPPFPPVGRKKDVYSEISTFEMIDQTAVSVAQSEQHSFTDLIRALTHNCKTDVEIARAIYRWITVKNLNLMEFDQELDPNTPMGILRGIKFGTESYHVLFKRLCSYAGLHCVVIKGYSKSAGYQPGMRFDGGRFRNTWNAVYLGGSWRFVQCNWGARHLVNARDVPQAGGSGRSIGHSESLRYEYDDHYFMTDPEEFIFEFFPSQCEWQLLKRPLSRQQFEELPFVRSLFFHYKLSFADPGLQAIVPADQTGAATVAVNMSPDCTRSLIFHYNLRFYDTDQADYNHVSLKRFVMQSTVGHSAVFRVHTPCRGEFLLDIFANAVSPGDYLTGQPMKFKSICKFKVLCAELNVIMVPLPECSSGEWGPAKAFRLFSMIPLSHEDAIINAGPELDIRFRMAKPLAEFVATLRKNYIDQRKLERCVSTTVRGDVVTFHLLFPDEGQYGLDIYTREQRTNSGGSTNNNHAVVDHADRALLTHCCKYLINTKP
ncbi:Kyphoscoliosis peptidase [Trichinella spiralis]|uniref:Kyphoscoliosis peptidase n=1 Tax=Trichinella spiralis TaxID=6334 RepID=A0A0V1BB77_TRISP|nr:Kyphoscoliosis peptidase [Trichinella spiralis]KRY34232.1 Kyphoscoliosis peptidase [Trichinella spiralis]